jgi:hypothetical protein
MKNILPLIAVSLLLTACTRTLSDASIHRRVVGTWLVEGSQPVKTVEMKSDGTTVVRKDGVETATGAWQVKDGYMIVQDIGHAETNKVLSISGDKMVVLGIDGQTQFSLHKQ